MNETDSGVEYLDISTIKPNFYNPNRMTPAQMRELVAEIRHLGSLPHPVVVRPSATAEDGVRYEIVDGEHRYRAGLEIGFEQLPCVILDIDEYEARRQTIKRNCGGRANKVLLGNNFRAMQEAEGKSRRQLAYEINVPEATIRTAESYANAGDLRKICAPETYLRDINRLGQLQIEIYVWLPPLVRDKWLDAGADVRVARGRKKSHWTDLIALVRKYGLDQFVVGGSDLDRSLSQVTDVALWLDRHRDVAGSTEYAHAVAKHRLGATVMAELPFCRRDGVLQVAIAPEMWESAVALAASTAGSGVRDENIAVASAVRQVLAANGFDLAGILGPAAAEDYAIVRSGPEVVAEAFDVLTLSQQRWLVEIDNDSPSCMVEIIALAKVNTVAAIRERGAVQDASLRELYRDQLEELIQASEVGDAEHDPATILAGLIAAATSLSDAVVLDRPAIDVLRERLDSIAAAEFNLLLAATTSELNRQAGEAWLQFVAHESDEE